MDNIFGFSTKEFSVIAAEGSLTYSIIKLTDNKDKLIELDKNLIMGIGGNIADASNFSSYIIANYDLYKFKNYSKVYSPNAISNFIRSELLESLSSHYFQVNVLISAYQPSEGGSTYWIDFLGTMCKVDKGAHGYGAYFVNGILDKEYSNSITKEEAIELIKKCISVLREKFVLDQKTFYIKFVSSDGIELINL